MASRRKSVFTCSIHAEGIINPNADEVFCSPGNPFLGREIGLGKCENEK
jgi:hypothetical protein